LKVEFGPDYLSYSVRDAANHTLFDGGNIAVFAGGQWCVALSAYQQRQAPAKLTLLKAAGIQAYDHVLGKYSGVALTWGCQLSDNDSLRMVTTVKNFHSGLDVLFDLEFPDGAPQTSTVDHLPSSSSPDGPMTNFPSLAVSGLLPNALSWQGSFVQGVDGYSKGPTGGPTVFYNASDPLLTTVVVGSVWGGNWKAFSAGQGTDWNGTDGYWAPGTSGRITSLPKGFRQSVILHASSGITAALDEWGENLQQSSPSKGQKIKDVTLTKVGYQTDNGSFYCFCKGTNCSATLIDVVESLRSINIPIGYLSFQGAGASSGRGQAAPWCIDTWGVDGGLDKRYPVDLGRFQRALGIPLQLYAPYFCPGSPYFNGTNWTAVLSDTSLPDCGDFRFQDVEPAQSRAFYDWFFDKGMAVGMTSFEPDFMNENFNCVPEFIRSATAVMTWQHGMASAAQARGISVQWCYATPMDVLAAVDMPAVTNFRVSFDFCYGNSWRIGVSSLLVWALGAAPSKDTLWTTDNHRTAIPGCRWTADHETPAAELHLVLALMSTGPVGISDAIGMTNGTLLKRAIRSDGTLLKPSKAITAIDSLLVASANYRGEQERFVYGTAALGPSWCFVSFKMKESYPVRLLDFWPHIKFSDTSALMAYRRFDEGAGCLNGADAVQSGCIQLVTLDTLDPFREVFTTPKSSFANATGGTDFAPQVTTVWQACPQSGWFFLGELGKYVALSPARFSTVSCTSFGVSATVEGTAGELVVLTALQPQQGSLDDGHGLRVITREVIIPRGGAATVLFELSHGISVLAGQSYS
jgi:hypothetical protein